MSIGSVQAKGLCRATSEKLIARVNTSTHTTTTNICEGMWEILSGRMKNRIIEFYGDVIKLDTPNLRLWAPIRDHKGILVIQYFFPFHTTGIFHNSS